MRRLLFLAILPVLIAGCASQPAGAPVTADQVTVHESVASAPMNFRVIKRLWVASWISVVGMPSYGSQAEAMDAFRQHAANLGGNGVINFGCYARPGFFGGSSLTCNGTVVRFL